MILPCKYMMRMYSHPFSKRQTLKRILQLVYLDSVEDSDTSVIEPIKGHWSLQPNETELDLHL